MFHHGNNSLIEEHSNEKIIIKKNALPNNTLFANHSAIIPGGNILAWGNNNLAQLGRPPALPKNAEETRIFKIKSSKRIIRCIKNPERLAAIEPTPSQVPNIPAPTISYQSYDVTPLAGSVRPLSCLEPGMGELTLHYALEQFHGLFSTFKILNKVRLGTARVLVATKGVKKLFEKGPFYGSRHVLSLNVLFFAQFLIFLFSNGGLHGLHDTITPCSQIMRI